MRRREWCCGGCNWAPSSATLRRFLPTARFTLRCLERPPRPPPPAMKAPPADMAWLCDCPKRSGRQNYFPIRVGWPLLRNAHGVPRQNLLQTTKKLYCFGPAKAPDSAATNPALAENWPAPAPPRGCRPFLPNSCCNPDGRCQIARPLAGRQRFDGRKHRRPAKNPMGFLRSADGESEVGDEGPFNDAGRTGGRCRTKFPPPGPSRPGWASCRGYDPRARFAGSAHPAEF